MSKISQTRLGSFINNAYKLDKSDPLKTWRNWFLFPDNVVCDARGNSLGNMPSYVLNHHIGNHVTLWRNHGHDAHFEPGPDGTPWWKYDEFFEEPIAKFLGADASVPEAVVCNSLSVNNYTMLLEFLALARRTTGKKKILTLSSFFNSDIESIKKAVYMLYGADKMNEYCVFVEPDNGDLYTTAHLKKAIAKTEDLALVFVPVICHKTGQRFNLKQLAAASHNALAYFGADLAHGIGNIPLSLSVWNVDFATFCTYKYLNAGPGAIGGLYVNKRHINSFTHLSGWWGIDAETRFGKPENFRPAKGARRFLSSNAPIFNMQGLRTYLRNLEDLKGGLGAVFEKHQKISDFAWNALSLVPGVVVISPKDFNERGCQISFRVPGHDVKNVLEYLKAKKCFVEDRGDVLRAAFVSYNKYSEVAWLARLLFYYTTKK